MVGALAGALLLCGAIRSAADLDAPLDPDLDGLTNAEEALAGTDPNNSDTDGGGENDGSEVLLFSSQDALDPSDDRIEALDWIESEPGDRRAVITFDTKLEYERMWLYRRAEGELVYTLRAADLLPTGSCTDGDLVNGTTYFYRMLAVDPEGHRSAVTPSTRVTPAPVPLFDDDFESGNAASWSDSVGLPGACLDPVDLAILGEVDVELAAFACAYLCAASRAASCPADCIADGTGLSLGCASCFGDYATCGLDLCSPECIPDPGAPACGACLDAVGCVDAVLSCSGLGA